MVNLNAFVAAIQNLTGEATSRELANFCRKWLDENADKMNANEADRLLSAINPQTYTLGSVCAFYVKFIKIKNDAELWEFLSHLYAQLIHFDARQIHLAPDLYNRLFEAIADKLLKKKLPLWGILLMERAILTCSYGHADRLTNLHSLLFCLCLKARHFDRTLPFLHVDVVELFKRSEGGSDITGGTGITTTGLGSDAMVKGGESVPDGEKVSSSEQSSSSLGSVASSAVSLFHKVISGGGFGPKFEEHKSTHPWLKRRSVLLYFYYGAMIFAALEQWEDAALFLEHAICLPMTKKNSAIVLEALKKYNIIWLILGRRKPLDSLPHYRASQIHSHRNILQLASVYIKLWPLVHRSADKKADLARALATYLEEKNAIFTRDNNVGLMKVLIKVCRENAVTRLGNIFVSLRLDDVSRMAHLSIASDDQQNQEDAEQIVLRLRRNNRLEARIDGRTQTVVFEEETKAKGNKKEVAEQLEQSVDMMMADVINLAGVVRAYEHAVRLNAHYVEKSAAQRESVRGMGTGGNGGGGGHSSAMTFPEDEGLFFTGSP